ncbi:MAG TPA: hypothetical protein VL371_15240 [Gemmataceae bacterium]|jgi:hypothetical protein|nr:hypothetical protein [Gemmataceae bacterium]
MSNADKAAPTTRGLSYGSILLGILGGAFYWWVPMGIVLSLTALVLGFIDWVQSRRRSLDYRLGSVAILVGVVALTLDCVVYYLGRQTITFGGLW